MCYVTEILLQLNLAATSFEVNNLSIPRKLSEKYLSLYKNRFGEWKTVSRH